MNYSYAVNWNSLVVMRLKIQEQRELNFVSRIIQCPLDIGNCPALSGLGGGDEAYCIRVTPSDLDVTLRDL